MSTDYDRDYNIDYGSDYDYDEDRRPSDWELDEWDDVGAVPLVEPLRHQSRLAAMTVWIAMGVVLALILAAGWVGWWYIGKIRPDGTQTGTVAFTVTKDDTVVTITDRLQEQGLIVDPEVFEWYVRQNGGLDVTPGYYRVPMNDTMGAVLATLRTPPGETFEKVTFPEGFTLQQMADRLAEKMPQMSAERFLAAAATAKFDPVLRPDGITSAEGLLFPDTYQISNADNEAQVVEKMATNMERVAVDQVDIVDGAAALHITPYQVLIIASIIEREAKLDVDRPKIARVIYNRLFIEMNLQVDATLYYGQDRTRPFSELKAIDSPYNTYLHGGLPPTPIANPGKASIEAALNPAPNPPSGDPVCRDLPDPTNDCLYLFYVIATPEGGHVFAATNEQQEANIEIARAAGLL